MPIRDRDIAVSGGFNDSEYTDIGDIVVEGDQSAGGFESFVNSMALNNSIPMLLTSQSLMGYLDEFDSKFNPMPYTKGYEDYEDKIIMARNEKHAITIQNDIDRERNLANKTSGVSEVLGAIAGGIADPLGWLPVGGVVSKAEKANKVLKYAKEGAKIATVQTAASELALQAGRQTKPIEESLFEVGAASLMGAVIGGAVGKLDTIEYDAAVKKFENDLKEAQATKSVNEYGDSILKASDDFNNVKRVEDLSSAATKKLDPEASKLVGTMGFAGFTSGINALLPVLTSSSVKARELASQLSEVSLKLRQSTQEFGFTAAPISVETAVKEYKKFNLNAVNAPKLAYKDYVKRTSGEPRMDFKNFKEKISAALIRNDVSDVPEIQKAAQQIRETVIEPIKNRAIEVKLFPEDVKANFAESYLTRMWNRKKIISNIFEFKDMVKNWALKETNKAVENTRNYYNKRIQKTIDEEKNIFLKNEAIDQQIEEINSRETPKINVHNLFIDQEEHLNFLLNMVDEFELENFIEKNNLYEIITLVNQANIRLPKRPPTIMDTIAKGGGVNYNPVDTPVGELMQLGFVKRANGKYFNSTGRHFDDMGLYLYEQGFFDERPGYDEILEAIDNFNTTGRSYSKYDADDAVIYEGTLDLRNEADAQLQFIEGLPSISTFYKDLVEEIKNERKSLRKQAKNVKEDIRENRAIAREAVKHGRPYFKELKDLRLKRISALNDLKKRNELKIKKLSERRKKLEDIYNNKTDEFFLDGLTTDDYVASVVDDVTKTLTSSQSQSLPPFASAVKKGPLKEKVLSIPDTEAEPFLNTDIDEILNYYIRSMAPQIEMKRVFGDNTLQKQIDEIEKEYISIIENTKDPKARNRIDKESKNVLKNIDGMRKLLLGEQIGDYNPDGFWVQSSQVLRDIQYMSKLGGVTVSSLPDMARSVMIHGLSNFFGNSKSLSGITKELKKISMDDLRSFGLMAERATADRLNTLADLTDPMARGSAISRFTGNMAQKFSNVTFINAWNDWQKGMVGLMTQDRIVKAIKALDEGTIKKSEQEYLATIGIDKNNYFPVLKQLKKYGKTENNFEITGASNWDNPTAHRLFAAAINKEADRAIVTKGVGDMPLWANTPQGKIIFQFRSFMMAAHNRVFLRSLQATGSEEVANNVAGYILMVTLGMMVAAIKAEEYQLSKNLSGKTANEDFDTSNWTTKRWIREGVDRSGLLAVLGEGLNVFDKQTGAISKITGEPLPSRYYSRNLAGTFLGPTVGTAADAGQILRGATEMADGENIRESDIYALRRNIPFQNLFGVRHLFDILEKNIGQATDAR